MTSAKNLIVANVNKYLISYSMYGVESGLLALATITVVYKESEASVTVEGWESGWFPAKVGLRQGCV